MSPLRLLLPAIAVLLAAAPVQARHQGSMWGAVSVMAAERFSPAAIRLADGRAFVVGGTTRYEFEPGRFRWEPQRSAEIYDPASAGWTRVADAPVAFGESAEAVRLPGGRVFVYEGSRYAYIYDPSGDAWQVVGPTVGLQWGVAITLLKDDRVMLIGGNLTGAPAAEVFDPATNSFTAVAAPPASRSGDAVTLLSGEVLYVGCITPEAAAPTADLYNPTANAWQPTVMEKSRCEPSVTRLADGSVLVAAGLSDDVTRTAELYDPGRRRWSTVAPMRLPRSKAAAVALPDGSAVLVGGYGSPSTAERFFPQTRTWLEVDGLRPTRRDPSGVLLDSGQALIIGGQDYGSPGNTAVIFESLKYRLGTLIVEQFATKRRHTARFVDAGTGAPVVGATLRFNANGLELCDATTGADGWASCPPDARAAAGVAFYEVAAVDVEGYRDLRCMTGREDPYDPDEERGPLDGFTKQGRCTARAAYE